MDDLANVDPTRETLFAVEQRRGGCWQEATAMHSRAMAQKTAEDLRDDGLPVRLVAVLWSDDEF